MQIKIQSHEKPEFKTYTEDNIVYSVLVSEEEKEDNEIMYSFYRIEFPIEIGESIADEKADRFINEILINRYKNYLNETDHKFHSDYELKDGETEECIEEIRLKRKEARDFIRENKES